jgi:hypothetical protein
MIVYIILVNFEMIGLPSRIPFFSIVPQFFPLLNYGIGKKLSALCHSSLMHSVESFELDDNCILTEGLDNDRLRFDQVTRLTHIRISLWNFDQCVHLLNQMGSQIHSFTVTIVHISEHQPDLISNIRSVSKISRFNISMNVLI